MKGWIKQNPKLVAISIGIIVVCIFLVARNIQKSNFLSADAVDIITILIGGAITLLLTEGQTDRRRRNDCIEHIVTEIETFVSDESNFKVSGSTLMKQMSCANKIKYLKDASFRDIQEEVIFISDHYQEIRDLYSNHSGSEEMLQSVEGDINRHRNLIVDKCCKIRLGLYVVFYNQ